MRGIELLLASATEYLCGMLVLAAFFLSVIIIHGLHGA